MPELVEVEMEKSIDVYANQLLSVNPVSAIGLMALAINSYRKGEIITGRDIALKGNVFLFPLK